MARADVSPRARADYHEIIDYVARDKPQAALRLSLRIQAKFELLAEHPLLGDRRSEFGADVRSATLGRYVIYYRRREDSIEVFAFSQASVMCGPCWTSSRSPDSPGRWRGILERRPA